jgi:hypothetical protein
VLPSARRLVHQPVPVVVHAVAGLGIRVVADAVAVHVGPLVRVIREGVFPVRDPVVVIVVVAGVARTVVVEVVLVRVGCRRAVVVPVGDTVTVIVEGLALRPLAVFGHGVHEQVRSHRRVVVSPGIGLPRVRRSLFIGGGEVGRAAAVALEGILGSDVAAVGVPATRASSNDEEAATQHKKGNAHGHSVV